MNPEIRFTISDEAAQQIDHILASHGMAFVRLSHERFEVLDASHPYCQDGESFEKFHGILKHENREFPCSLEKYSKKQILSVTAQDLEEKHSAELIKILEHAFPQPRRGITNTPKPERTVDKSRIVSSIGCVAVLVVILGILFLAVVGAISAFR